MLVELKDLLSNYPILVSETYDVPELRQFNRPSVLIKLGANTILRVVELKKGFKIMFEKVRFSGKFHNDVDICLTTSIIKTRSVLDRIISDKSYGTRMAAQRANPIIAVKVYDKFGQIIHGVNRIYKSDMAKYSAQGYTFRSYNKSEERTNSIKLSGRSKSMHRLGLRNDSIKVGGAY